MVNRPDGFSWNEDMFSELIVGDFAFESNKLNLTILEEGFSKSSKNIKIKSNWKFRHLILPNWKWKNKQIQGEESFDFAWFWGAMRTVSLPLPRQRPRGRRPHSAGIQKISLQSWRDQIPEAQPLLLIHMIWPSMKEDWVSKTPRKKANQAGPATSELSSFLFRGHFSHT